MKFMSEARSGEAVHAECCGTISHQERSRHLYSAAITTDDTTKSYLRDQFDAAKAFVLRKHRNRSRQHHKVLSQLYTCKTLYGNTMAAESSLL